MVTGTVPNAWLERLGLNVGELFEQCIWVTVLEHVVWTVFFISMKLLSGEIEAVADNFE